MASDDLDDTSPEGLFNFSANKIEGGWGIDKFIKTGLGLTIVGTFVGIQDVFGSIVGFFVTPLDSAANSVSNLFEGLISDPVSIITGGTTPGGETFAGAAATTGTEISQTFTGWLGPLAFPVGVASIMLGLYVVTIYLEERETSDIFPGSFTDIDTPEWLPIIGDPGVPEEGEDQEDRD